MSEERKKKKIVKLELGDIIRIDATDNEEYNGQSFYINYIDLLFSSKIQNQCFTTFIIKITIS